MSSLQCHWPIDPEHDGQFLPQIYSCFSHPDTSGPSSYGWLFLPETPQLISSERHHLPPQIRLLLQPSGHNTLSGPVVYSEVEYLFISHSSNHVTLAQFGFGKESR